MPKYTENLNLFKYDTENDGKSTFNVDLALNDNFDKIDTKVGEMETQQANIDLSNLSTTGNSKLNAKANIDLSNLSTTGEKRFEDISTEIAKSVAKSDLYDSNGYIKIDRILKEKYSSGSSWYRVYSDGWIEQGGRFYSSADNEQTITLLQKFANTNYVAISSPSFNKTTLISNVLCIRNRSTTSFSIISSSNMSQTYLDWFACGY